MCMTSRRQGGEGGPDEAVTPEPPKAVMHAAALTSQFAVASST